MFLKTCSKCNKNKSVDNFYNRKTGPRTGEYYEKCKECMKSRGRRYYHQNHDRQLRLAKIRNKKVLTKSIEVIILAKNKACLDCRGYFAPWSMDFDHRNPEKKIDSVASLRRNHNVKKLKEEIAKCDLVCSNCHRTRTISKKKSVYYDIISRLEKDGEKFYWKI